MINPKINIELAELIGIILGDGSINIYPKINNWRLKITLDSIKDIEYVNYIKNLIYNIFKEKVIIRFRKNENTVDIFLFKRDIIRYFLKIGLKKSPKWERAIIPKQFLTKELEKYVLRGLFDTDGSLVITNNNGTVYPRLEVKICPSPMQNQFINILKRNNFNFGVYNIRKGQVRIQMNGQKELKKWCELIGFSNNKHIRKFEGLIARGGFEFGSIPSILPPTFGSLKKTL